MKNLRLGAVGYLNARPLVWGLGDIPHFDVRFDVPSRCAELLHGRQIDVGLIPSIEYLRGDRYRIVPDLAIASRGPVASVLLFTRKPLADVRSLAMDTSSRTSVALANILCARRFRIAPILEPQGPDLSSMLARSDAALLIGDNALFAQAELLQDHTGERDNPSLPSGIETIDLGQEWGDMTGLPFLWAFWAGRDDALAPGDVDLLRRARDEGTSNSEEIARRYCQDSVERQQLAARYLRDNIKYTMGPQEHAALELFYRYAFEVGEVAVKSPTLEFY
jgi:chorismate dehydratase